MRGRVDADLPRMIADLERLVRIPSIGYPGYDPANVRASAEATAEILRDAGVPEVRLIELTSGEHPGHPAVFGEIPGPDGAPTLLLYAHHDVQPEGEAADWESPPFEPVIRRRASVRPWRRRRQGRHRDPRRGAARPGRP